LRAPVTAHTVRSDSDSYPCDDEPVPAPPQRGPAWLDWLDATDPGQMRLRMASEVVLAIAVVLAAEWLFVRGTGALQVAIPPRTPAPAPALLWQLNHALLVIALMLGAILALIAGFGVNMFGRPRDQLLLILFLPLPMLALLAIGLSVHVRLVSLALLAVVLAVGTYCRRFGPPGFMGGMLAFMGAFLGFFIQDYVSLADFGWLAAEIAIGAAGIVIVHFVFFWPRPETAVRRMQRSYAARARALASEVAELYEATTHAGTHAGHAGTHAGHAGKHAGNHSGRHEEHRREERRLQRQLLRLNETALLIDAQLNSPGAVPAGWSAAALHQLLFDAEVELSNIARFALALARHPLPSRVHALVLAGLTDVRDGDLAGVCDTAAAISTLLEDHDPERTGVGPDDRILLRRFAMSVRDLATALRAFRLYPASQPPDDAPQEEFQPQVATFGGWLPGSAFIAGAASQERGGTGLIERIRLAPYARISIQMGIAVGGAIIAGDALSGRRFYWAVIAAFITFMGANTAGEQLRKSVFRIAGTVVGVLAGSVLAHLVGDRVWLQIVVILVSLFLGLYLFRVNYTFMTIGITVMVSQLYVELGEFSNNLLLLRLAETSVGAGVAIATVLLVLPLHIGRVARVAARQQLAALADLADRCLDRLANPASATGSDLELRAAARRVDMAYQALVATVWPMRTPLFGRLAERITGFLATAAAARHYARNLLLDASTRYADLDTQATAALADARRQLADSVGAVTTALAAKDSAGDGAHSSAAPDGAPAGPADAGASPPRTYVRSASLFARVADTLPGPPLTSRPQLALRDLQLLDGALAEAARWADVPVTDLDTHARRDGAPR
jgi:hypothetical protein